MSRDDLLVVLVVGALLAGVALAWFAVLELSLTYCAGHGERVR